MLDTYARKYIDSYIQRVAQVLVSCGLSANVVTVMAFLVGILSGVFVFLDYTLLAIMLLWLSGFLDAVDGAMARLTRPSEWGTVMDVTFDRIVEISVILGLAFRFPEYNWAFLLLSVSIILSMTVFLTVAAVSEKKGIKSFYYQAGLAERTEGFIMFSLMMALTNYLLELTLAFTVMILVTALQRFVEAKRILK